MGISRVLPLILPGPLLVAQLAHAEPNSVPASAAPAPTVAAPPAPAAAPDPIPVPAAPIVAPSNAVPIEIHGSIPGLRLEIQDPKTRRPLAYCTDACQATIVPGRYRFFANATPETRSGGRDMEIVQPSKVLITPRSESQHSTGLVLGIAGPALMVVGAALFLTNLATSSTYDESGERSSSSRAEGAIAGLGMMVGGMVLTPIGWVMFGTSFRPRVQVTPLAR